MQNNSKDYKIPSCLISVSFARSLSDEYWNDFVKVDLEFYVSAQQCRTYCRPQNFKDNIFLLTSYTYRPRHFICQRENIFSNEVNSQFILLSNSLQSSIKNFLIQNSQDIHKVTRQLYQASAAASANFLFIFISYSFLNL